MYFVLKGFYVATRSSAYINNTIVTTTTTDVYILQFVNMLHAAYIGKIVLPDDG
jgi:hypothetical protein